MKPEEREYMTALRGIYYNLNMGDKFDAIEAEMNSNFFFQNKWNRLVI